MKRPVSSVLISCNEERRISACLESLFWADEIVVVDSGSTDETVSIARRYTDRVFTIPWQGFGLQKQTAVNLASHDLVFVIDCDERVTPELAQELQLLASAPTLLPAYSVPRRTFVSNREIRHCGWYPDRTVRFFDRSQSHFSDSPVHERVIVTGALGACRHHLLHYSFDGFADMLRKMNRYTDMGAEQLHAAGRRANVIDVTIRPLYTFLRTYLLQQGFRDGFPGYLVSVSNAVSVFSKYAKLMERLKDQEADWKL